MRRPILPLPPLGEGMPGGYWPHGFRLALAGGLHTVQPTRRRLRPILQSCGRISFSVGPAALVKQLRPNWGLCRDGCSLISRTLKQGFAGRGQRAALIRGHGEKLPDIARRGHGQTDR